MSAASAPAAVDVVASALASRNAADALFSRLQAISTIHAEMMRNLPAGSICATVGVTRLSDSIHYVERGVFEQLPFVELKTLTADDGRRFRVGTINVATCGRTFEWSVFEDGDAP